MEREDRTGVQGLNRLSGERVRTPGSPKSKSVNPKSPTAVEQGRARERRIEINSTNTLEPWKMFDSDTVFHFRMENMTICGFGPTDNPEYQGGLGGAIVETDHACRLCHTAARQQGVELAHPANGEPV